jgi:outer membrane immunogenic protein
MLIKRAVAASAMLMAGIVAASAADIPPIIPPPSPPPPPPAPTFDWTGPYVGIYGGHILSTPRNQAGVQAGFNIARGALLAGVELQAGAMFAGGTVVFEGNLNGRLGAVLGDRFLLYGEAGVGTIGFSTYTYTFGGGAEVAIADAISIFAEAKGLGAFGGGCCVTTVQVGLNWHPGN